MGYRVGKSCIRDRGVIEVVRGWNNTDRGGGGGVFFFNDTATTEIYTLSLHDALPICGVRVSFKTIFYKFY